MDFTRFMMALCFSFLFISKTYAEDPSYFLYPNEFQLLYIDGASNGLLDTSQGMQVLTPGHHEIVLRYKSHINRKGSLRVIQSEPVVLQISFPKGETLQLEALIHKYSDDDEKERFAQNPQIKMLDQDKSTVTFDWFVLPAKQGVQWSRDYLAEIQAYKSVLLPSRKNLSSQNVENKSLPEQTQVKLENKLTATPASEKMKNNANNLNELQRLYLTLDKASKKQFQIWIIEHQNH